MTLTAVIALLVLALLILTLLGWIVGKFSKGVRQGYAEAQQDAEIGYVDPHEG